MNEPPRRVGAYGTVTTVLDCDDGHQRDDEHHEGCWVTVFEDHEPQVPFNLFGPITITGTS